MNRTPDVERVLREFLADDGSSAPDHVLDVIEDRINRQRQKRTWRLTRRLSMNPLFKLASAAAAVLVLAVVGWNLLPGRTGPVSQPSPSPSPTLTPSITPTATPEAVLCEDDIPGCAGPLEAGDHATQHFTPPFEYSTEAGWDNPIDTEALFTLWPDDSLYRAPGDLIMVWSNVVPADRSASCELGPAPGADASVAGWMTYLTNHPGLITTNQRTIDLNGSIGQAVDLKTNGAWVPACDDDASDKTAPLVTTVGGGGLGDGYGMVSGVLERLYAIQLGNQTVVITVHVYGSPSEESFTTAADLAESVINTFNWVCKADSPAGPCWGSPDASGNPATPPPAP